LREGEQSGSFTTNRRIKKGRKEVHECEKGSAKKGFGSFHEISRGKKRNRETSTKGEENLGLPNYTEGGRLERKGWQSGIKL